MLAPSLFEDTHPFLRRSAERSPGEVANEHGTQGVRPRAWGVLGALLCAAALFGSIAAIGSVR